MSKRGREGSDDIPVGAKKKKEDEDEDMDCSQRPDFNCNPRKGVCSFFSVKKCIYDTFNAQVIFSPF